MKIYRNITFKILVNKIYRIIFESKYFICYKAKTFRLNDATTHTVKRVVFFCQFYEEWNSLRSVFEKYQQNTDVDAWIVAIPKQEGGYFKSVNEAYDKLKLVYADRVINGYKNGKWFNLKGLHPDAVFYYSPYNHQLPKQYQINHVYKYSKTCYIPYGYELLDYHGTQLFDGGFYAYLDKLFVCHKESLTFYKEKYEEGHFSNKHYIYDVGCPRFDIIQKEEGKNKGHQFTIMWLPRWTVDKETKESHFLKYVQNFLTFADRHPKIDFVLRPHPLMFSAFINAGFMSENEVKTLRHTIKKMKNCVLDEGTDYLEKLRDADVILSDFSSMLAEMLMLNKPVIYMDDDSGLYNIAKQICACFYSETEWLQIEARIQKILNGQDEKQEERLRLAKELKYKHEGLVAEEIEKIMAE